MNRKRNKWNMEKIFATVITMALMIALIAGVTSILKKNGNSDEGKKNYINLNDLDEAASNGADVDLLKQAGQTKGVDKNEQETTKMQTADNTEAIKENDEKGNGFAEAENEGDNVQVGEGDIESGNKDVAKNTDNEGKEGANLTEADNVAEAGNVAEGEVVSEAGNVAEGEAVSEAGNVAEGGAVSEAGNVAEGGNVLEAGNVAEGEIIPEAAPVNAATATMLGYAFGEGSSLMWPVTGNVILSYNMTNTIYFPTLGVYKCNPAIVISCDEGSTVAAATDGIVMSVFEDEETGLTLQVAVGNDYVITYGQLKDLAVGVGSQVSRGDVIGSVATPTKYFSTEGSNLYFKVENAETPVDPMEFLDGNE